MEAENLRVIMIYH